MKNIIVTLVATCLTATGVFAQNLNTHFLYQQNWYNINPAITGNTDGTKAIINPGTQWVGMDNNPTNSMFGVHGKMNDVMGLGAKVIVDERGFFSNITAEGTYSYGINLTKDQLLTFGVTAGMYQSRLMVNNILADRYTDALDPTATSLYYDQTSFMSGFGMFYQYKNLEAGVSAPHLVVSGMPTSNHIFMVTRYNKTINNGMIKLTPHLVYQNMPNSPNILDLGLKTTINEIAWAQYTYRTNNVSVMALGFNVKNIQIGYAYGMGSQPMNAITSGSHELIASMTFGSKKTGNKAKTRKTLFGNKKEDDKISEELNTIINDVKKIVDNDSKPKKEDKKEKETKNPEENKQKEDNKDVKEDASIKEVEAPATENQKSVQNDKSVNNAPINPDPVQKMEEDVQVQESALENKVESKENTIGLVDKPIISDTLDVNASKVGNTIPEQKLQIRKDSTLKEGNVVPIKNVTAKDSTINDLEEQIKKLQEEMKKKQALQKKNKEKSAASEK